MKKLAGIILSLILLLNMSLMVGCNKKNYPKEKGATEIMFYAQDFEDWSNDHLYDMVKEFNSNLEDGIQITMIMYEDAEYTQALKSARDGGYSPEIFMVSYGNLAGEIKKGYPAPLNDLMPKSALDDIIDYVKEMVCYDDVIYGYPQLTEPSSMLFYRKDMLSTAGVTKDPALWDWQDLISACEKIKPTLKKNQYTIGLPTGLALAWSTIGLQYNTAGHLALNDNWDDCAFTDTINKSTEGYASENEYANVARLWWDLYGGGYVPAGNVSPTGYNDIIEGVCDNKIAMTVAGSWSVAEIMNTYPDYIDKIGIAPLPTKTGNKDGATATNGGWTYAISNNASQDKKEKSAKFINWLLAENPQRTASYFEAAHYSKAAVTKSVNNYIEQNAGDTNLDWRNVINDVAAKAISEPLYSFDVSLLYSDIVLGYCSINADPSQNDKVDSIFSQKLKKAKNDIRTVIEINKLAGTNPKK